MEISKKEYISLIFIRIAIAIAIYVIHPLGKLYLPVVAVLGLFWIFKNENKNNEVLYVAGYDVGGEVLHRMTGDEFIHEFGKYSITFFCHLGVFFSGMSRRATIYLFFLVLLLPSVVIGAYTLGYEAEVRKAIVFNISGPVTLAVSSIYCFEKRLSLKEITKLLLVIGLPIVSTSFYLFLYTPSIKDVVTGTASNFETSGGFGPNQVSTILGFGAFVFFSQLLLESKRTFFLIINLLLLFYISFRGIVTFSRGGMITAGIMAVFFLVIVYLSVNTNAKGKLFFFIGMSFLGFLGVWAYSSSQTNGLIEKRYANEDAIGRKKESQLTGREDLMATELEMFLENPIFGVGVGRNKEIRLEKTGIDAVSHNEITRMVAEHGIIGLIGLCILFFVPINYYFVSSLTNRNLFVFSFVAFWLFTINHAAMRLAAPAFIYALSLLNVYIDEKPAVHR